MYRINCKRPMPSGIKLSRSVVRFATSSGFCACGVVALLGGKPKIAWTLYAMIGFVQSAQRTGRCSAWLRKERADVPQ